MDKDRKEAGCNIQCPDPTLLSLANHLSVTNNSSIRHIRQAESQTHRNKMQEGGKDTQAGYANKQTDAVTQYRNNLGPSRTNTQRYQ